MKNFTIKKAKDKKISYLIVALIWLALWQFGAMVVKNPLIFPSIFDSAKALVYLMGEEAFYLDCLWTLIRTVISIALSYLLGICLAWFAYRNQDLERILSLPVAFFKAVPVMAIVIYFIIIVDSEYVSILVSFLMCFPVVYTNALGGFKDTDAEYLELAQVNRFTTLQTLKFIYLPSMRQSLKSALSLIAGMSWKAVIAAEILAIPAKSLGYDMLNAKYYLETPELFAYIAVVIVLSVGLEKVIIHYVQKDRILSVPVKNIEVAGHEDECLGAVDVRVCGISKSYGMKKVLDDFSIKIENSKTLALMAPSGSGKTTFARILAGLEEQDSGKIEVTGTLSISYLFQEDRLLPWLTVYGNIAIAEIGEIDEDRIKFLAKALEIEPYLNMYPSQLSGGLCHRVAIARTLAKQSNFVILDEPFRGLDKELKSRIVEGVLKEELKEKSVLLISHDEEDVKNLEGNIIKL